MDEQARTYVTMAGKSIGKCSSGHWLPLKGNCDLCGAGPDEKCRFASDHKPDRRCSHGKLFTESCEGCGYVHPRDR